jgi:hypothetical protein
LFDIDCYIVQSEGKPFFIFHPLVLTNPRTGRGCGSLNYIENSGEEDRLRMVIKGVRMGKWSCNRG